MHFLPLPVAIAFWLFSLLSPVLSLSEALSTRGGNSSFVSVSASGTRFSVHGKSFNFVGTNAYWLPYLNSDDDIRNTLANMSKVGITVVRTWAFNDVTSIPSSGSWLQLFQHGNTTINTGSNGIQRLDKVIQFAKQYNIYVYFSLTNNWFPTINAPNGTCTLPRNYLSNNYGGMDVYVQTFGAKGTHDEFYTNKNVRKAFYKYVQFVTSRYANEPGVIAWELANDARCASSVASSIQCNTNTLTRWHAETAKFIRSIDCNHLITPGVHGSLCPNCPKLFPPTPGSHHKRTTGDFIPPWGLEKPIVKSRAASSPDGKTIRGHWSAPDSETIARRNTGGGLSVFNGAFGVDSEDILNAPDIDFGSFQLFPDSVNYGTQGTADQVTPPSTNFNKTLNDTTAWIKTQIFSSQTVGKPVVLSAFGIVTQDNLKFFVPVNDTCPAPTPKRKRKRQTNGSFDGSGVAPAQINTAYSSWFQTSQNGAGGANQYMFSGTNLATGDGVVPNPNPGGVAGSSPNDGLDIAANDAAGVLPIVSSAAATASQAPG